MQNYRLLFKPVRSFQSYPGHHSRVRRGTAFVEFALVLVVLLTIIVGVIEFSVYSRNSLKIANACREGARAAAVGLMVAQVKERVKTFAAPLSVEPKTDPSSTSKSYGSVTLEFSTDGGTTFRELTAAQDRTADKENGANPDSLIRVTVVSRNRSITGAFGALFDRDLRTEVTMRRERK